MDTLGSQDYDLSVLLCPPTFPQETLEKLSQPQNKTVIVICHWKGYYDQECLWPTTLPVYNQHFTYIIYFAPIMSKYPR